jgi:hypothetical protein
VEVVLADTELDGDLAGGAAHVVAGRRGLLYALRLGEQAPWRLPATRPASADQLPFGQIGPPVPAAELQALLDEAGLGVQITGLAWSARVRLQHRVAERLRPGRLYLAGDAAHAYSPATGQGMNAGIQDAANLGWKLAFAASKPDSSALLGSYDRERRPVARQILAMTHLAFWGEASTGRLPSLLRGGLVPLAAPIVPALMARRRLVAAGIRILSQLRVSYRGSPLSVEGTPRPRSGPRAGDRLPDNTVSSAGRSIRLHELLARPGVHVLLDRDAERLDTLPLGPLVHVHRLTSASGSGLMTVRPDGYIGLRCRIAEANQPAWLARVRAGRPEPDSVAPIGHSRGTPASSPISMAPPPRQAQPLGVVPATLIRGACRALSLGTASLLVMTASGTGSAGCVRCWRVSGFLLPGSSRWRLGPRAWGPGALASSGYGQGAGARARPHGL